MGPFTNINKHGCFIWGRKYYVMVVVQILRCRVSRWAGFLAQLAKPTSKQTRPFLFPSKVFFNLLVNNFLPTTFYLAKLISTYYVICTSTLWLGISAALSGLSTCEKKIASSSRWCERKLYEKKFYFTDYSQLWKLWIHNHVLSSDACGLHLMAFVFTRLFTLDRRGRVPINNNCNALLKAWANKQRKSLKLSLTIKDGGVLFKVTSVFQGGL